MKATCDGASVFRPSENKYPLEGSLILLQASACPSVDLVVLPVAGYGTFTDGIGPVGSKATCAQNQTNTRANNPEQSIATPANATARKANDANSSRIKAFRGAMRPVGLRLNHSARSAVRRSWAAFRTSVDPIFGWFHTSKIPVHSTRRF